MRAFEVEHRTRACGYALVEQDRPGRFDAEMAIGSASAEGPAFGALQRGESVQGGSGPVTPAQVMGEARGGRTVVISGDTAPCLATAEAARGLSC